MSSEKHEEIEAICKFGPGGDFVTFWPVGSVQTIAPPVVKVAKVDGNLFGDEFPVRLKIHHHRPAHRIRSTVRNVKKKPAYNLPGQGSLFETELQNAKTA